MSFGTVAADLLVVFLNSHPWALPFEAARKWVPVLRTKDMEGLNVVVALRSETHKRLSRKHSELVQVVDVGFQARVRDMADLSLIDPYVSLVSEIRDRVFSLNGPFYQSIRQSGFSVVESEVSPIAGYDHLIEMGVFTSVLSVSFRAGVEM